jgi:ketosteroid isomerase-like protein
MKLLLAVLALAAAPAWADPLDAVKAADLALAKALLDSDRAAFTALLEPEAIFLDAPAPGRDAAVASWSHYFEENRLSLLQWKPDGGGVAASGELAWTTGPFDFERKGPDGKFARLKGRYLTLWKKSEAGFRVWADGSWQDPAAAVATERKPLGTIASAAGDLQLVVGETAAKGRYATVSEPDGKGGWRVIAAAASPPAE